MLKKVPSGKPSPCPFPGGTEAGRDTAGRAAGRQYSLHASAVCCHAGAVHVLVDLHRNEVGRDGNHQPIPDDSQDADGLQELQPDSCGRGAVSEAALAALRRSSRAADQAPAQGQVWHGQKMSGKEPSKLPLSLCRV